MCVGENFLLSMIAIVIGIIDEQNNVLIYPSVNIMTKKSLDADPKH